VGIGARDLSAGLEILYQSRDQGVKWTSANLYGEGGDRLFTPYHLAEVSGVTIAMVGITGPGSASLTGYHISDPAQELETLLPALERSADLIMLLSTLSLQENLALGRQFPRIGIIIGADTSTGNLKPVLAGGALVTQTANRGQYLGILRAGFSPGQPWIIPPAEQLSKLTSQLKNINRTLSRRQASNTNAEIRDEALKKLASQRDQLQRKIDDLAQQAASPTDADPGSTYRCDFLKIAQTGRSDAQIEAIIEQARRDIRALQEK
jgi:2',3'-cyclic-nucleotide 2'-phosphodiesterase (5'-nucleotidase family)